MEIAFCDARRLGRIRLRQHPQDEPPISTLGFDPIHSMITVEDYSDKVLRRKCPIKALLLDQSFNAGVGNWVADEILFQAKVHPERRCHTLDTDELTSLHANTRYVCETAVAADAESSRFPPDWLFHRRWDKRKSESKKTSTNHIGSGDSVSWTTVGGRTSAFVPGRQPLTVHVKRSAKVAKKSHVICE